MILDLVQYFDTLNSQITINLNISILQKEGLN